jgi:hypothetical protein
MQVLLTCAYRVRDLNPLAICVSRQWCEGLNVLPQTCFQLLVLNLFPRLDSNHACHVMFGYNHHHHNHHILSDLMCNELWEK